MLFLLQHGDDLTSVRRERAMVATGAVASTSAVSETQPVARTPVVTSPSRQQVSAGDAFC